MADDKKSGDKKKEAPAPAPSLFGEFAPLWILIGGAFLLSAFLTNWNGVFFNIEEAPEETIELLPGESDRVLGFPRGVLKPGIEVVGKDTALVRDEPAGGILGKQPKYTVATIDEGPVVAYGKRWWRLDYEEAPSGWVVEDSLTSYVSLYRSIFFFPIIWPSIQLFFWILSAVLLGLICYAKVKGDAAKEEAEKRLQGESLRTIPHIVVGEEEPSLVNEPTPQTERESNTRWMHVVQLLESYNQSDWRQAIVEADIVLEEMLEKMGYDGVTIGDKLKNIESSDFLTLNQAWEAHKVRNKIAHMGSQFNITQHEARKVIGLYQEVFEEFYFI